MSIVPSPWPVAYVHRYFSDVEDDHGNFPRVEDPPVIRYVMSITQSRGLELVGSEHALQVATTLDMVVADPTIYHPDDWIMIWPELDADGDYVDGTGELFWVDGNPEDERQGPWPTLLSMFGGTVKLRRVT